MQLLTLLEQCVTQNASDLHLSPNSPPLMRINGDLTPIHQTPLSREEIKTLIYSVMNNKQQQQFEQEWELDFTTSIPTRANFRINAFYQQQGIAAALRVIPNRIPTLKELNMPAIFKTLLKLTHGLILITGPTGAGKSTTLAAMVNYINNTQEKHIITIEDPIEFTHQSKKSLINQRQVHRDTHDFARALRSSLREDPDVILLGEMRDLETIRLALTAAETGHLVMATLHTSSAPRTINRIIDVFSSEEKNLIRNMLSESLQAVICQTLVKSNNGNRVAALEIMLGTPAIRNLIREDKIAQMYSVMQTSGEVGMLTMEQSLQKINM